MKVYQVYQTIVLRSILREVLKDVRFMENINLKHGTIANEQIMDIIESINSLENNLKYKNTNRLTAIEKAKNNKPYVEP